MSPATGQSVAVRLSPNTIKVIQGLAEKTQYSPSKVAYIVIDGGLPTFEAITKSYESGILSIARWIDKLMSWALKGVRKKAAKVLAEAQEKGSIKPPPKETFTVWLPNEAVERIDVIAKRFYMTRGRLVALLLEAMMNRFSVEAGVNLAAFHDFVMKAGKELNDEFIEPAPQEGDLK